MLNRVLQRYTSQAPVLAHQRPEGVMGAWKNKPSDTWNRHEKIANATGGWVSLPNLVTWGSALLTAKGIYDIAHGKEEQGLAEVIGGRLGDLGDGWLAKKLGVASEVGAANDAFADKVLAAYALYALGKADILPKRFTIFTAIQQARTVAENVVIQQRGGEPNPNRAGKDYAADIWLFVGASVVDKIAQKRGFENVEIAAMIVEHGAEAAAIVLSEISNQDYRQQRLAV